MQAKTTCILLGRLLEQFWVLASLSTPKIADFLWIEILNQPRGLISPHKVHVQHTRCSADGEKKKGLRNFLSLQSEINLTAVYCRYCLRLHIPHNPAFKRSLGKSDRNQHQQSVLIINSNIYNAKETVVIRWLRLPFYRDWNVAEYRLLNKTRWIYV